MLAIILGITIPIAYILAAAGLARHIMEWGDLDEIDRPIVATFVGIFWPLAYPIYAQMQIGKKRRKARIERG